MVDQLFHLQPRAGVSLQLQLQEMLVSLILEGHLEPGSPLPSSRKLASMLALSRNTVTLVYARLTDEGYLVPRERRGHYVNPEFSPAAAAVTDPPPDGAGNAAWTARLQQHPSQLPILQKPRQWRDCPYPFIYGQPDYGYFPAAEWRECARRASSRLACESWIADSYDSDDPVLIQQLRQRVLPLRGIRCTEAEILVTLGTQHSLYLLSRLLLGPGSRVGIESPGYLDARNCFLQAGAEIEPLPVDEGGLVLSDASRRCGFLYLTPSHQYPTTVTMPRERREALLEQAERLDQLLIEDDYESETRFSGGPTPALKSLDRHGRVVYVGSFSKTLAPGLRMGYLVGPSALVREARALRRLMLRHPPANNQRTLALFVAAGYHDSLLRRLTGVYHRRRQVLRAAMARHLAAVAVTDSDGGSALWCQGPPGLDAVQLQHRALGRGVFIEAGAPLFFAGEDGSRFFRMGYSAIDEEAIGEGVRRLADLVDGSR